VSHRSLPATLAVTQDRRAWATVLLAAVAWLLLYARLPVAAEWVASDLLGLESQSRLGQSLTFFLFDVPKILLLLVAMVFLMGVLRSFFSTERTRNLLGGRSEGWGNILAASLGVVTPFCSCSAVPLFIAFVEAGIPLGVTFSFLIAAPVINEVAVILLLGMFGWKIAGLYVLSGLIIATFSGMLLGRLHLERHVEEFVWQVQVGSSAEQGRLAWSERFRRAAESVRQIVGRVWPYVVGGIAVGAGIHGFVPQDALVQIMGRRAWWSVPAAVAIGVPLYSNAAGVIPVVSALIEKGAAVGTSLAFMMSVVGLSLPELIILRRVLKPPLLAAFVGVVAFAIILTGYLFNLIL
jgi:hypothetical protein